MDSVLLGAQLALSFLVTYLIHSTLLLGGAWALGRALKERALALQDLAWKIALVGGPGTATLRVLVLAFDRPVAVPAPLGVADLALLGASGANLAPHPGLATLAGQLAGWERALLLLWSLGALLGLGLLARSWQRLRTCLASRRPVAAGPLRESLDALVARATGPAVVRLSDAPALPVPVARGVLAPEICLPSRVIAELGEEGRTAVLAHELAHVVRRDPAWLLASRAIEGLFFVQPLNRLARVRLQRISEYLADAWAVEVTGNRKGLAQCLVEVAGWLRPPAALLAPGMAGGRGALTDRVERILGSGGAESGGVRSWSRLGLIAFVLGIGVFAPALAPPALLEPALAEEPAATPAPRARGAVAAPPAVRPRSESPSSEAVAEGVSEALAESAAATAGEDDAVADGVAGALAEAEAYGLDAAVAGNSWSAELATLEPALAGAAELPEAWGLAPEELAELAPYLAGDEPLHVAALAGEPALAAATRLTKDEVERLEAAARELAERSRLSQEELEHFRARAREFAEQARRSRVEDQALQRAARELAAQHRPSREEVEQLRAEARELAKRSRPSPEAVAKLQAEARALVERSRPQIAELDRLRELGRTLGREARRSERSREQLRLRLEGKPDPQWARELAAAERRLEAALERVRALRAEAERRQDRQEPDAEVPEPPRP